MTENKQLGFTDLNREIEDQKRNEAFFALAADIAYIGMWEHDPVADQTIWWSERNAEIMGVRDWRRLTPEERAAHVHPADHARVVELIAAALAGNGGDLRYELRWTRPVDGRMIWIHVIARLSFEETPEGRRWLMRGATIDITKRKEAEEALRSSENRFRTLADAVLQLVWASDAAGRATYFNKRWYAYSGLSDAELRGSDWQVIIHPDDAPVAVERWQHALALGEVFDGEYRLRRADNVYRWFLVRNVPIRDKKGVVADWFGTATDIEALKQAEAARQTSDERLRLVVASVQEYAIITLNPDSTIIDWNSGAAQIFGHSANEILGRKAEVLFTPEDRAIGVPAREQQVALAKGRASDERWHIRADGSRFFGSGVLSPVYDPSGTLRWFVKVVRDLTERKRMEDRLRATHDELEQRVQERTAALAQSNAALQTEIAQRKKAENDRRQLLRQLMSAQEAERLRIARDLHDQFGQQIAGLLLGLKQVEEQVQDTDAAVLIPPLQALALQMSREAHRLAVNLRPTALDDMGLVSALERLITDWSKETGVHAEISTRGLETRRLPAAFETALYRIVQEALTNVRKHAVATTVSVIVERRRASVLAIIEDNGRGYDADETPESRDWPSLGILGMRERVAQFAGTLEIESSPGNGTTVFVRIPLNEREA